MSSNHAIPPSPEVQHLPTLFKRIQRGDVRIPAFQRQFVWSGRQILELLESVYKGYPIGSLLFWRVDSPILRIERRAWHVFPEIPEDYPLSFVLDGLQRLSSLYGVFHGDGDDGAPFRVIFDLRERRFAHFDADDLPAMYLELRDLFVPRRLLEAQRRIAAETDGDQLIDATLDLHSTFQSYMVPIVTISGRRVEDVVEIFERVNNTGTRLSSVDFMRALTWSASFDLNTQLDRMEDQLSDVNFPIAPESLIKVLAVVLDHAPTSEAMLSLRECNAKQLLHAVERALAVLDVVRCFLRDEFRIHTSEYLPYEGQLLVLCSIANTGALANYKVRDAVGKWFWSTSLSEGLRGKPDHYVVRAIADGKRLVAGDAAALHQRFDLSRDALLERRFIKGKALSAAVAAMFAVNQARSLVDGQPIEPIEYMSEFTAQHFMGLLPASQIRGSTRASGVSTKLFANIVLVADRDLERAAGADVLKLVDSLVERLGMTEANRVLESQYIEPDAVAALAAGEAAIFLTLRADAMLRHASQLSGVPN